MTIKRNDLIFSVIGVVLAIIGAILISNPDVRIGLFSIVALIAIGVVVAIYVKPSLGAIVLIIVVFSNISSIFTERGLPGINKPLVAIVAAAILVRFNYASVMPGTRGKTGRIMSYLFLYLMVTALSYFAADIKERSIEKIIDLGKDIVIIYCFLFALRSLETWRQAAWSAVFVTSFLCFLAVYQVVSGNYLQEFFGLAHALKDVSEYSYVYRLAGPIEEPNIWGMVIVAVVPLAIHRLIYEQNTSMKLFSAALLGILLFGVLNTYSRGAYLALAVLIFIILIRQRLRLTTWFILGSLVIFAIPFLPASYIGRFQTLTLLTPNSQNGIYQEDSFRGRTSKILTGLIMFANRPILGVGVGNYPNNYQKYTVEVGLEKGTGEQDPHSLYVQILAETGILGGITFVGFSYLLLANLSRVRKSIEGIAEYSSFAPWISAIQLALYGYLIASLFLHAGYIRYFWLLVALALSAIQLSEDLLISREQKFTSELSG